MKSPLLEQVSYFKVISTILYIFHLHISPAREICITRDVIFLENKEFHYICCWLVEITFNEDKFSDLISL